MVGWWLVWGFHHPLSIGTSWKWSKSSDLVVNPMNKRVETSQVDGFHVHFHANGIELNSMHLPACTAPWNPLESLGIPWNPLESLQFADQMMHFPIGESTNPPKLGTYRRYVVFFLRHIFIWPETTPRPWERIFRRSWWTLYPPVVSSLATSWWR